MLNGDIVSLLFIIHICRHNTVLSVLAALWPPAWKGLTSWLSYVWCFLVWFVVFTFQYGVLGQVWYFIVSIPDRCFLLYFYLHFTSIALAKRRFSSGSTPSICPSVHPSVHNTFGVPSLCNPIFEGCWTETLFLFKMFRWRLACVVCNSKTFHFFIFKLYIMILHTMKMCTFYTMHIDKYYFHFWGVLN